ncbi:peptidase inhibitor family I36 protein [Streptomyces ossamyceticus]|nr:peptidase inhibitor family I36 protein [Streptomyces ossamyceticus]
MKARLLKIGLITLSAFGLGLSSATGAQAAEWCRSGDLCLYYNSGANHYGAIFVQNGDISNYGLTQYFFVPSDKGSAGAYQNVKNNAAAVENRTSYHAVIYYNSGYNCEIACQQILSFTVKDLNSTMKNNNASGSY